MKTRLDINNFVQQTTVLSCSQFTRCIHLSKRKAEINKKNSGRSFCVSKKICVLQAYFTSKSWRQIWWCVKYLLSILFISVFIIKPKVWGEQCYACVSVFYNTDLEQDLFFLALFKPIILQFFTILQDKLRSFNIQDDRSTRFLWAKNYRIDRIIKRFH